MEKAFAANLRGMFSSRRGKPALSCAVPRESVRNEVYDDAQVIRMRHQMVYGDDRAKPHMVVSAIETKESRAETLNLARLLGLDYVSYTNGLRYEVMPVKHTEAHEASAVLKAAVADKVGYSRIFDAGRVAERVAMRRAVFGDKSWLVNRFETAGMTVEEVERIESPYERREVQALGPFMRGHDVTFWEDPDKRDAALFILGLAYHHGVTYYLEHVVGAAPHVWVEGLETRVRHGLKAMDLDVPEYLGSHPQCVTPGAVSSRMVELVGGADQRAQSVAEDCAVPMPTRDGEEPGCGLDESVEIVHDTPLFAVDLNPVHAINSYGDAQQCEPICFDGQTVSESTKARAFHTFTKWLAVEVELEEHSSSQEVEVVLDRVKIARECMAANRVGRDNLEAAVRKQLWLTTPAALDSFVRRVQACGCDADEVVIVGSDMITLFADWLGLCAEGSPIFKRIFLVNFGESFPKRLEFIFDLVDKCSRNAGGRDKVVLFTDGGALALAKVIGGIEGPVQHMRQALVVGQTCKERTRVEFHSYPSQRVFFAFTSLPPFVVDTGTKQITVQSTTSDEDFHKLWDLLTGLSASAIACVESSARLEMVTEGAAFRQSRSCGAGSWVLTMDDRVHVDSEGRSMAAFETWGRRIRALERERHVWEIGEDVDRYARLYDS